MSGNKIKTTFLLHGKKLFDVDQLITKQLDELLILNGQAYQVQGWCDHIDTNMSAITSYVRQISLVEFQP